MPRQRKLIVAVGICALLLGACSLGKQIPVELSTPAAAPVGPYDGIWIGQGRAADGRLVTVKFTVQASSVASFIYEYPGLNGLKCTAIEHRNIPAARRPRVGEAHFAAQIGEDLLASGSFSSQEAASGHIALEWKGRENCSAKLGGLDGSEVRKLTFLPLRHSCIVVVRQHSQLRQPAHRSSSWTGQHPFSPECHQGDGHLSTVRAESGTAMSSPDQCVGHLADQRDRPQPDWRKSDLDLGASSGFHSVWCAQAWEEAWPSLHFVAQAGAAIASLGLSFILYEVRSFGGPSEVVHRGEPQRAGLEVPTDGIRTCHGNLRECGAAPRMCSYGSRRSYSWQRLHPAANRLGRTIRSGAESSWRRWWRGQQGHRRALRVGRRLAGAAAFVFALYYSPSQGRRPADRILPRYQAGSAAPARF
jgi:hypothetical protein